mgnify:CR=1 FL=1
MGQGLVEEILILVRCEVGLSRCLAAERLTVAHLLQVVQAAGDTLVAGAVEGIEGDAGTTIHTGVDLGTGHDRIQVSIHDAGSRGRVGVDEVGVRIGCVVRSLKVAVAERCLDDRESRYGLAVALQLGLALMVSSLDSSLAPPLMLLGSQTLA